MDLFSCKEALISISSLLSSAMLQIVYDQLTIRMHKFKKTAQVLSFHLLKQFVVPFMTCTFSAVCIVKNGWLNSSLKWITELPIFILIQYFISRSQAVQRQATLSCKRTQIETSKILRAEQPGSSTSSIAVYDICFIGMDLQMDRN